MLGWAGVWCCAGAEIQAWGTGLFQAGNMQCIVGKMGAGGGAGKYWVSVFL